MSDLRIWTVRGTRWTDGEYLITLFPDGSMTLAYRDRPSQTWSPPETATEEPS